MKRVPDFIIVGAAKSGTSSLAHYMDMHPSVAVVSNRLEHFGPYMNPAVGDLSKGEYLDLFKDVPPDVKAGEKSVSYLYAPTVPDEICAVNPDMKIMIILRDPVTRAYSDYWNRRRAGSEVLTFDEALAAEDERIAAGASFELHYVRYGYYADRVQAYFDRFGRASVCVFRYEDLKREPAGVCRRAFAFLGVSPVSEVADYPVYNKGGSGTSNPVMRLLTKMAQDKQWVKLVRSMVPGGIKDWVTSWMNACYASGTIPPMDPVTEARMRAGYAADIERLERLLGWDLNTWRNG